MAVITLDFATKSANAPKMVFTYTASGGAVTDPTCIITVQVQYKADYALSVSSNKSYSVTCDGQTQNFQLLSSTVNGKTGTLDIQTCYFRVNRNADGTARTISISATADFTGWNWGGVNLGSLSGTGTMETTNVPIEYICYFKGNGGTPETQTAIKRPYQQLAFPSVNPRSGYNFLGWADNASATTATYNGNTSYWTADASLTFYAVWEVSDIQWSLEASPKTDNLTLKSIYEENFGPTISFEDTTGITFTLTTPGDITDFKYRIDDGDIISKQVTSGTQNNITIVNKDDTTYAFETYLLQKLCNLQDKTKVSVFFTGSFVINGSYYKTFAKIVTFNIVTEVTDVKAELVSGYKTSADSINVKYKLSLPLSVSEDMVCKNLVVYPYGGGITTRTINGISITVNEDGSIVCNGTATSYTRLYSKTMALPPGTYTYYGGVSQGYSDSTFHSFFFTQGDAGTFTLDNTMIGPALVILIKAGYTCNNLTFYPQVERGNDITSYQRYFVPKITQNYKIDKSVTQNTQIFTYTGTVGSKDIMVSGDINESYITLLSLYNNNFNLNPEVYTVSDKNTLVINYTDYDNQAILQNRTGEISCTEFIETSDDNILLQKGGRVWAREFIEEGNDILYRNNNMIVCNEIKEL